MKLPETLPFAVPAGSGDAIPGPAGGTATIKARAEATGGTFAALENIVAPGSGPPCHAHLREDEVFYVIEGKLRYSIGDSEFDVETGALVFIPRRTPHTFRNVGDQPARLLVMYTPGGMERYFEERAKMPPGPLDPTAHQRIAHDSWMELLEPSPA